MAKYSPLEADIRSEFVHQFGLRALKAMDAGVDPVADSQPESPNSRWMNPLRAARMRCGLSLEALAKKAGVSKATLHNAEKKPSRLSDKTAAAVAPILGVEPKELFHMSVATIDITEIACTLPPPLHASRVVASVGVLGSLSDPEDPMELRAMLLMLLAARGKPLVHGDVDATLISTAKGRSFVMIARQVEGVRTLSGVNELEWRLGRGSIEVAIYRRPPQVTV